MTPTSPRFIGTGVYSLPEAERLIKVPRSRVRRWLEGYSFSSSGRQRHSTAVLLSDIGRESGQLALSFADLIEIRFLDAFLQHGVSWHTVRIAADRARHLLSRRHPFSTRTFKTDGHDILVEIVREGGVPELLNLAKNQWELERVVTPMLYAGLDFNEFDEPARWWPRGVRRSVVIDPTRAFGAPIALPGAVPTAILAASAGVDGDRMTAAVYEVPLKTVRHAVEFEASLAA
jgi:hypothetical protein